ncbi:MAG TPA: ubiquinone/menaquinone biosynthesis methyltransferase [Solirubrobacteraceae bacterium]|nr:ubiquinone/menaquinone biosynthesis methyltransferase [Solirubrobacteraceae bacterium]
MQASAIGTPPLRQSPYFAEQVNGMFDRLAARYDLLNSLMTARLHHRWRERAADRVELVPGERVLDVGCGTGDLTLEIAGRVPGTELIGCDFSEPMLGRAREKSARRGTRSVRFEHADALRLPYADASFDAVTTGFALRNLADTDRGLAELARVVRPGGRVVVLDFTRPRRQPFSAFYSIWLDRIVPVLGALAKDPGAYTYLPESVRAFHDPHELAAKMTHAGFENVRCLLLAGGIVTIHSGRRRVT